MQVDCTLVPEPSMNATMAKVTPSTAQCSTDGAILSNPLLRHETRSPMPATQSQSCSAKSTQPICRWTARKVCRLGKKNSKWYSGLEQSSLKQRSSYLLQIQWTDMKLFDACSFNSCCVIRSTATLISTATAEKTNCHVVGKWLMLKMQQETTHTREIKREDRRKVREGRIQGEKERQRGRGSE